MPGIDRRKISPETRATARITQAASASRSAISHHGVRAGVSSRGVSRRSSATAGKLARRGAEVRGTNAAQQ